MINSVRSRLNQLSIGLPQFEAILKSICLYFLKSLMETVLFFQVYIETYSNSNIIIKLFPINSLSKMKSHQMSQHKLYLFYSLKLHILFRLKML